MTNTPHPSILLLGGGYVLQTFARTLEPSSFVITSRDPARVQRWRDEGWLASVVSFDARGDLSSVFSSYSSLRWVIDSVPSDRIRGPVSPKVVASALANHPIQGLIYLSSTGVYGVDDGSIVTEETPCDPKSETGKHRVLAESIYAEAPFSTYSLRLSGIYGPGRGIGASLRDGTYRVLGDGERFTNRIHVDDIVAVLRAILEKRPSMGHHVYNVTDDYPAPMHEVIAWYCNHFGLPYPSMVSKSDALAQGKLRLLQNQRISNAKMKRDLLPRLSYPTFREGAGSEFTWRATRQALDQVGHVKR